MPTFVPSRLVSSTVIGTSAAALFTSGTSTAVFRKANIVNITGSSVTVTLYQVPAAGSAAAANAFVYNKTLVAGESWIVNELNGMVFADGSSLHAVAGTGSALVFTASGILYTP